MKCRAGSCDPRASELSQPPRSGGAARIWVTDSCRGLPGHATTIRRRRKGKAPSGDPPSSLNSSAPNFFRSYFQVGYLFFRLFPHFFFSFAFTESCVLTFHLPCRRLAQLCFEDEEGGLLRPGCRRAPVSPWRGFSCWRERLWKSPRRVLLGSCSNSASGACGSAPLKTFPELGDSVYPRGYRARLAISSRAASSCEHH